MARVRPEVMADRLLRFATSRGAGSLRASLVDVARDAGPILAGVSVGRFMRDAPGGLARRRSATDRGPLRIVTGRLARAVAGRDGQRGGIEQVTTRTGGGALSVTLTKGVVLSIAPGGHNEGRRAKSGRDLSFLGPAAAHARPMLARMASARIRAATRKALGV